MKRDWVKKCPLIKDVFKNLITNIVHIHCRKLRKHREAQEKKIKTTSTLTPREYTFHYFFILVNGTKHIPKIRSYGNPLCCIILDTFPRVTKYHLRIILGMILYIVFYWGNVS